MDDFKITISAARTNARKTMQEVADYLHVSKQTIFLWEHGRSCPTVEKAMAFCDFCNVPFDRVTFLRERNAIK